MTLNLGQIQLYAAREIISAGTNGSVNYAVFYTFPVFNVTRISFTTELEKQVQPIAPSEDDTDPAPLVISLGIKTKEIKSLSGYFTGSEYYYNTTQQVPALDRNLKENTILMVKDSTSLDNFPELEGAKSRGLWKIKTARWSVDAKSLLWVIDMNLKYVWEDPEESMFFGGGE